MERIVLSARPPLWLSRISLMPLQKLPKDIHGVPS
jgi:hypothetical protein